MTFEKNRTNRKKKERHSILLVEDNADDEALILRALRKSKIINEVDVVRDGAEALEYLFATGKYSERSIEDEPEFVLLDLKLPKVNGFEVLKNLRSDERTKYLPVVVFTSSDADQDVVESYSLGANSYVRKPISYPEFAEAVRQLEVYWLVLNMSPDVH